MPPALGVNFLFLFDDCFWAFSLSADFGPFVQVAAVTVTVTVAGAGVIEVLLFTVVLVAATAEAPKIF